MTVRQLAVRVANLPPGAALWRAQQVYDEWRPEAYLLADIVDTLRLANWQRQASDSAPKPTPVQRPVEARAADSARDRILRRAKAFANRQARQQSRGQTPAADPRGGVSDAR